MRSGSRHDALLEFERWEAAAITTSSASKAEALPGPQPPSC
jgi:hypothetical protein